MPVQTFVEGLRRRGITLRLQGDQIVAVPGSLLTSDEADRIRENKFAIVQLLLGRAGPTRLRPFRSHCLTCGVALDERSVLRCPACVATAYAKRDQRRRAEGRAPPGTS